MALPVRKLLFLLSLTAALLSSSTRSFACTTFVLHGPNTLIFGRNLDWLTGTGLLIVNPRNLRKVSIPVPSGREAEWVSRYGSVTFNQVGRELPYGGINESGLVVEHMTLDQTKYPAGDDRAAVQACQWIQYQLDTCSTIEEVIASNSILRIADGQSKFHFLVCDRSGHSAVIEFLDGKMAFYRDDRLPVTVLANSNYQESLRSYQHGGKPTTDRSIYNFVTAAEMVRKSAEENSKSAIDSAFSILSAVSQGLSTKWSIVYDLRNMNVHFKVFETPTIVGESKIFLKPEGAAVVKSISLSGLDFGCAKTVKVADLDFIEEGSLNPHLTDYTPAINLDSISKAFAFFKSWGIPIEISREDMVALSNYPNSFKCEERK